jgi:hypothetical protein
MGVVARRPEVAEGEAREAGYQPHGFLLAAVLHKSERGEISNKSKLYCMDPSVLRMTTK